MGRGKRYQPEQVVNFSGSAAALPGRPQFDSAGNTLSAATMQTLPDWEPNSTTAFVQPFRPPAYRTSPERDFSRDGREPMGSRPKEPFLGDDVRLREFKIKNFRKLDELTVAFPKGLSVIVGENNTDKTAIIDASRLALIPSRDLDALRITEDDFRSGTDGAPIEITCTFCVGPMSKCEVVKQREDRSHQISMTDLPRFIFSRCVVRRRGFVPAATLRFRD